MVNNKLVGWSFCEVLVMVNVSYDIYLNFFWKIEVKLFSLDVDLCIENCECFKVNFIMEVCWFDFLDGEENN